MSYTSQEHEIERMAEKHGIRRTELHNQYDKAKYDQGMLYENETTDWKTWWVERNVWNHFFKRDSFPGHMPTASADAEKDRIKKSSDEKPIESQATPKRSRGARRSRAETGNFQDRLANQPWVHDMYSRSQLSTTGGSNLPRIDSYTPNGTGRITEIDSYKPTYLSSGPPAAAMSKVDESLKTSMSDSGQHRGLREEALSKGISEQEYKRALTQFTDEVNKRYKATVNPAWMDWKIGSMVWAFFFTEPFLQLEPPIELQETRPLLNGYQPVLDSHASCWQSMETKALAMGVPLQSLHDYHKDRIQYTDINFASESAAWRQWFADSCVWNRFFPSIPQISHEPPRKNVNAADQNLSSFESGPITASRLNGGPLLALGSPSRADDTKYIMLEKVMEKKAMRQNNRHNFFSFLQTARDKMRERHEACTKDVRHYYADLMTWNNFWGHEPFPGIKPNGGHSAACLKRTLQQAKVDRNNVPPPPTIIPSLKHSSTLQPTTVTKTGQISGLTIKILMEADIGAPSKAQMTRTSATFEGVERVVAIKMGQSFQGKQAEALAELQRNLGCQLTCVSISPSGTFDLQIKPTKSCKLKLAELAFKILVHWTKLCISGSAVSLASFVTEIHSAGFADQGRKVASAMAVPTPIIVNGRYVPLCLSELENVRHGFTTAYESRRLVEANLGCRFYMIEVGDEDTVTHMVAVSNDRNFSKSEELSSNVLWLLEEGSEGNKFLEAWVMRAAPASKLEDVPDMHKFWCGESSFHNPGKKNSVALTQPPENSSSAVENDMEHMIQEECIKVEGLSRLVYDDEDNSIVTLREYKQRLLARTRGGTDETTLVPGTPRELEARVDVALATDVLSSPVPAFLAQEKRKMDSLDTLEEGEVVEPSEKRVKL